MASLFKGVSQAQHYATCRPTYPPALYEMIASKLSSRSLCVDIGCGTGQATVALADYFDEVIGIDPSPTQIEQAPEHTKVTYRLGTMEEHLSQLDESSVSCITSAQAAHWLDISALYGHAQRVLKPGGVIALWTYGLNSLPNHPSVESKLKHLYEDVLGDYWDDRRRLVENMYRDIPLIDQDFPEEFRNGERISSGIDIEQEISGEQLVGYLRSWSGYTKYCRDHNIVLGSTDDPVQPIEDAVAGETKILSLWPVALLISTKRTP